MKLSMLLVLFGWATISTTYSSDVELLANNKETVSTLLKGKHEKAISEWITGLPMAEGHDLIARNAFISSINMLSKNQEKCDIQFYQILKANTEGRGLTTSLKDFHSYIGYLRKMDIIDDILYEIIIRSADLDHELRKTLQSEDSVATVAQADVFKDINISELYASFTIWPDEISVCSNEAYKDLVKSLTWKNEKDRDQLLKKLNYLAYKKNIIHADTYRKLEVFRTTKVIDWPVRLGPYLEIIDNAKDKYSPSDKPVLDPSKFSTKYVDRKKLITNRGRLYRTFNSTQVMMMAEIIYKTSKRIDSHFVSINFQYDNMPGSETETYVLSPLEKYRLSINMLKKDLATIMRSDLFKNTSVGYEDLVTAAYETGLIGSEELNLILKFEDFWNPKNPKWKVYMNFAFSIVGTAAFYLPPPYNIIGAIALVVTQTQLKKKLENKKPEDSWNAVI